MRVEVAARAMEQMFEHCRKEFPNEACGYLAGPEDRITEALPIRNAAASPTWYEMDPKEQIQAQRCMRDQGLKHIGVYHSHVATDAYPSSRDIERAAAVQDFYDGFYFLVTLKDSLPRARAFTIRDGHVTEEDLLEV